MPYFTFMWPYFFWPNVGKSKPNIWETEKNCLYFNLSYIIILSGPLSQSYNFLPAGSRLNSRTPADFQDIVRLMNTPQSSHHQFMIKSTCKNLFEMGLRDCFLGCLWVLYVLYFALEAIFNHGANLSNHGGMPVVTHDHTTLVLLWWTEAVGFN